MLSPTRCPRHINHTAVQAKCIGVVGERKTNHAFFEDFLSCFSIFILLVVRILGFVFVCLFLRVRRGI